jgi:hypothetical protein
MMNDYPTIRYVAKSIVELGAQFIQFEQVRSLIIPERCGVDWVSLDERFHDVPHHRCRVFRIQPDVRVPAVAFSAAMDRAVVICHLSDQSDSFGSGYDQERGTPGSLDERRDPDLEPEADFKQQPCLTDCHQIAGLGSIGVFVFIAAE